MLNGRISPVGERTKIGEEQKMTHIEEMTKKYEHWKNGAETLVQSLKTVPKDRDGIENVRDALRAHLQKCPSLPLAKLDRLTLDQLQDLF